MKKRSLVFLTLTLAVILLVTITRVWVVFTLSPDIGTVGTIPVTGSAGNGALMPVAIAILAMAVVLGIAGRTLRLIIGILITLFGIWIVWSVWSATQTGESNLFGFGQRLITESTGLVTPTGDGIVDTIETSMWPIITIVVGVLLAMAGCAVMVFGWRWVTGGKKYETTREHAAPNTVQDGSVDRISDWDALSGGNDPSHEEVEKDSGR